MSLHLVFSQILQISLDRFVLSLFLFATTCGGSSVGSQFDVVANRKLFIDRTLLVEHFLSKFGLLPWFQEHLIIIGARKSGKSTNLSMIKQFFGVCVDESGKALAPNATKHYTLFKNLKIGQRPYFEHAFASIPVLHINLADFVVNGSEVDFKKSFCKVIRDLMTEHKYLLQNKDEDDFAKRILKSYTDAETCQKESRLHLTRFGYDLASLMHGYFNKRVLVLVDEIDAPAISILDSNVTAINEDFIRDVFDFVLKTIEDNMRYVMSSFLTGATKQGALLGYLCVRNKYAFDPDLKYFYGVTENEVRRLLSISGIPLTKTLMQELRDMYGGYGVTDDDSKEFVFNTQSILKFCESKVIKPYWDAAAGIAPFKKLLPSKNDFSFWHVPCKIEGLIERTMYSEYPMVQIQEVTEKDLFDLKDYLSGKIPKLQFNFWDFFGYLWESGFFTRPRTNRLDVTVPNNENRQILLDLVFNKDFYMAKHGVGEETVRKFVVLVAQLGTSETSLSQLAEYVSRLFAKRRYKVNDQVFRYPLYNYLCKGNEGIFSKVIVDLGRKKQDKSDIIVTLKDGPKVFIGLTLDKESGQNGLRQVLKDEQLQEFRKGRSSKFICLGINLLRSDGRCDVSYLDNSTNLKDARNETRQYQSIGSKISKWSKRWFQRTAN